MACRVENGRLLLGGAGLEAAVDDLLWALWHRPRYRWYAAFYVDVRGDYVYVRWDEPNLDLFNYVPSRARARRIHAARR